MFRAIDRELLEQVYIAGAGVIVQTAGRRCVDMLVLGIEGSANKVGVGIVRDDGEILANPRHTCASAHPLSAQPTTWPQHAP